MTKGGKKAFSDNQNLKEKICISTMVSKLHAEQETGKNTCEYLYNTHIKCIKKHHLKIYE